MTRTAKTGLEALLTPEGSVLVLIDHQPFQFADVHSHEPTMIVDNVVGQAGVVPVTWMAVAGEWQRDRARESTTVALGKILAEHGIRIPPPAPAALADPRV